MPSEFKTLLKSPVKVGFSLLAALIIAGSCWGLLQLQPPVPDPLLPYVKLESKWTLREFNDFTAALDQDRRNSLKKALKIGGRKYNSKEEEITAIRRQFHWTCYYWLPYICDPLPEFPYHEVVQWTAGKLKLDKGSIAKMTTFELERKILEATFAMMWDKLTPEQRAKVLESMDKNISLDRAGIAAMSGTVAIAALSKKSCLSGFGFYAAMTSSIVRIGNFVGRPAPLSAYFTESNTAALLSGPVGRGIAAVVEVGEDGRSSFFLKDFVAPIIQIHYTKIQALHNSGVSVPVKI